MALTLAQLQTWRDSLVESRLSGVRRVRDQSGEEVEYRSDREMAAAIAAAEAQIAALSRGAPRVIHFKTSKGLL